MNEKQIIILNSTILYIIASLTTTMVHEFAHAIVGAVNGSEPVLHHNYVEHLAISHLSVIQKAAIAFAGPLLNLVQGLLAGWLYLKSKRQTLFKLFLLWFSILGISNFLGYLMIGPIFQEGDIGKIYQLFGIPFPIQLIIAVAGAGILFYVAFKLTIPFLQFSYQQEWVADPKARKHFSFRIIVLPWIFGSVIVTVLYLPVIAIASIIYPVTSGMIFIFPWKNAKRVDNVRLSENKEIGKYSAVLYFSLLALIIVFRFILAPGRTL